MDEAILADLLQLSRSRDFNCWNLVDVALARLGEPRMPHMSEVHARPEVSSPAWQRCECHAHAVAVFFRNGVSQHVGIMVDESNVLHMRTKTACCEPIEDVSSQYQRIEFYEPFHP